MKTTSLLAAALSGASVASAHTIFLQLKAGGTTNPIGYGIRTPSYDGPITDVTSNDVVCNGGPNPTTPSDKIIDVKAGETVTAIWRHTLTSGPSDVMDASHKGPTIAYMKKVDNAVQDSGIGGGWFKIQEDGYNNGVWGTSKVIENGGNHAITIPSCIPDGQYLLRAEMIALHAASGSGGAQLYMECAQIRVSGGSGSAPSKTYSLPGIYKATDPGILINIYSMTPSSKYVIPGPELFTCGANGGGGNPPAQSTTLATSTKPAEPTNGGGGGGCTAQKWAQCGGIGFTGCTTCVSGSTCQKSGDYYSQCV